MDFSVDIVEAIRKNRNEGADLLVATYKNRLFQAALGLCGDATMAEDLVFRTFEQVVAKIDTYREKEAFFGWMHTILINYYRMSLRGNVHKNTVPVGGMDEVEKLSGAVAEDAVVAALDGNMLRKAVEQLPSEMREVVVLHYFMDQPVGKIAKILSIAKGTVKSRLYYARLALGIRLGAVLKKPAVAVIAIGFFIAAAFAATFMVAEHPQMAEVDEPIFLYDSPVPFEVGLEEPEGLTLHNASPSKVAEGAERSLDADTAKGDAGRAKSTASLRLADFCSTFKESQSKPLPSFNSTAPNPVTILFR